jgi:hypothetical protein
MKKETYSVSDLGCFGPRLLYRIESPSLPGVNSVPTRRRAGCWAPCRKASLWRPEVQPDCLLVHCNVLAAGGNEEMAGVLILEWRTGRWSRRPQIYKHREGGLGWA